MTRHSVRTLPAALVLLVLTTSCAGLPRAQSGPSTPSPAPTVSPADDGATPTPTSTPRGASRSAAPTRTPSPAPTSFAETYALVSSGVVRIDVQGCGSAGSGSGFLIGRDLVATVAHVVDDAATVRVTQGTRSVSADVLGLDQETDSALLRTARPLSGHVFDFSAEGPVVGSGWG